MFRVVLVVPVVPSALAFCAPAPLALAADHMNGYLSQTPQRAPADPAVMGPALVDWLRLNAASVIRWPWRGDVMAASVPARVVARDMGICMAVPIDTVDAILRARGLSRRALAAWMGGDASRPRLVSLAPGYPPVRCVLLLAEQLEGPASP